MELPPGKSQAITLWLTHLPRMNPRKLTGIKAFGHSPPHPAVQTQKKAL
jgi:hypothetical protein